MYKYILLSVGYGSQGQYARKRYKTGNTGHDGWETWSTSSKSMYTYTISAVFGHTVNLSDRIGQTLINTFSIHVLNTMFVIQVEIEDQPAIEGSVDEQVQDMANVAYQERWVLRQNTMATFNTTFQGYQFINKGFMDLSKLINGTPLNAMGQILNAIQESAARSAGYAEGGREVGKRQRKWFRRGRGEERRVGVGRGLNTKGLTVMTRTTRHEKFQSVNLPHRKDKQLMYNRTVVWQHTHIPPMTWPLMTKSKSHAVKIARGKWRRLALRAYWTQCARSQLRAQDTTLALWTLWADHSIHWRDEVPHQASTCSIFLQLQILPFHF